MQNNIYLEWMLLHYLKINISSNFHYIPSWAENVCQYIIKDFLDTFLSLGLPLLPLSFLSAFSSPHILPLSLRFFPGLLQSFNLQYRCFLLSVYVSPGETRYWKVLQMSTFHVRLHSCKVCNEQYSKAPSWLATYWVTGENRGSWGVKRREGTENIGMPPVKG